MKKIFLLPAFFCLISLVFSSIVYSAQKTTIAVLDFEAKNISQETAEAVTDLLRTELFNTGRFQVVERDQIRRIIDEQHFQTTGLTDADQAVEIGRLLNVQAIMVGTVNRLGNTHFVNTRLISVRTGLVVIAESVKSSGGEENLAVAITELSRTVALKTGLEGSLIRVDKKSVLIDLGEKDGMKKGQLCSIIRLGDVIVDLEGRAIGTQDEVIGLIEITKVQDLYSEAKIREKNGSFLKGDKVKPVGTEQVRVEKPKKRESIKQKPDVPVIF